MPHDPMALALLASTGPLAVTSANRSGDPTPTTCDEIVEAFGDLVSVYLCRDEPLVGAPSTVVDLAGEVPRVLREGAIPLLELELALSG
jgi:tRNA A37 threonylcarbamoyladenosine synthetase subunit TsaC/SUA5/YrdC